MITRVRSTKCRDQHISTIERKLQPVRTLDVWRKRRDHRLLCEVDDRHRPILRIRHPHFLAVRRNIKALRPVAYLHHCFVPILARRNTPRLWSMRPWRWTMPRTRSLLPESLRANTTAQVNQAFPARDTKRRTLAPHGFSASNFCSRLVKPLLFRPASHASSVVCAQAACTAIGVAGPAAAMFQLRRFASNRDTARSSAFARDSQRRQFHQVRDRCNIYFRLSDRGPLPGMLDWRTA
jgi:hypothetical protein